MVGSICIVAAGGLMDDVVSGDSLSSKSLFPSLPALLTNFESRSERDSIVEFEGGEGTPAKGVTGGASVDAREFTD